MNRLVIKHAIGSRTFFDSNHDPSTFTMTEIEDGGWEFRISIEPESWPVTEIIRLKDELNVFIFKEEDGKTHEKIWFYVAGGRVNYNDGRRELTVAVRSNITYNPADYPA